MAISVRELTSLGHFNIKSKLSLVELSCIHLANSKKYIRQELLIYYEQDVMDQS